MFFKRQLSNINLMQLSGGYDIKSAPEDAEKENGENLNDTESADELAVIVKSTEESKIMGEIKVSNESKTIESDNGDDSNTVMVSQSECMIYNSNMK